MLAENVFGIGIVKYGAAMQRAVVKNLRSLNVWIISMYLGWEAFLWLQVYGICQELNIVGRLPFGSGRNVLVLWHRWGIEERSQASANCGDNRLNAGECESLRGKEGDKRN
eukprot:TRINITY_DN2945_c0_g1_i1.p5 TRINITY_DN2945_c0_g1~~TRINITY_DN2945_c0_g1_i1.p5  ORF type:complete len:111 (-),score=3.81 TRINITY_DN2945_c0_g1_i1:294-626(-)